MSSIQLTEEQYAALPEALQKALKDGPISIEAPKPKKWEPKGGDWTIHGNGDLLECADPEYTENGHAYDTKEAAEWAAAKIRKYARQLAYVHEHAPGYVVPPIGEEAWFVYENRVGDFFVSSDIHARDISTVYMPREVAQDLARKLNSGEVEF